jgi:hypothetical protein
MLNHFPPVHLSEEENDISRRRELALLGAVLVGGVIVRVNPRSSHSCHPRTQS